MPTLRELAAESIGRITRRTLEPQLAQIEERLSEGEQVVAVAPGHDGPAGVVVVITDARVLLSAGAPFAKPVLQVLHRDDLNSAVASAEGKTWALTVTHPGGEAVTTGMFDRDAQRFAGLLAD